MPAVVALAERYRTRGLRVVSTAPINRADNAAEKQAYADLTHAEHMSYPCYLDEHSAWAHVTGLALRPAFMVIGRDGKVTYRVAAVLADGSPELRDLTSAIEQALGP